MIEIAVLNLILLPVTYLYLVPRITHGAVFFRRKTILSIAMFSICIGAVSVPIFWFLMMFVGEGLIGALYECLPKPVSVAPEWMTAPMMICFTLLVAQSTFFATTLIFSKIAPQILHAESALAVWKAAWIPSICTITLAFTVFALHRFFSSV